MKRKLGLIMSVGGVVCIGLAILLILNAKGNAHNENETKEETEVGIDYLIYFFEEQATKEEYADIDIELYMNENDKQEEEE